MPKRTAKGFTLIEIMVSVAIIAILSAIGFTTYSSSQVIARDARRKQDLKAIQAALEVYYQQNKRYPCPGDNVWNSSSGKGFWITDTDYANCNDTSAKVLDQNYINTLPSDPKNSGPSFLWNNSSNSYYYGYRGYFSAFCPTQKGQFYLLVAELENTQDPDRNSVRKIKDCNGVAITGTGWDNAYVLSNL